MNRKTAVLFGAAALGYSIVPTGYYKCKQHLHQPGKALYLTFDDGPDPQYTPQLLDLLEQYHIPASFFVVAQSAQSHPDLIARMKRNGHVIGLHSLAHKNGLIRRYLPVGIFPNRLPSCSSSVSRRGIFARHGDTGTWFPQHRPTAAASVPCCGM